MKKIGVFVLFLFIGFNFCTKNPADESNTSTGNRAPDIVSMTAVPAVLNINMAGQVDSALVTVIVTDYDDTCVTYTFNASLGKLSNQNGKEITYTPPAQQGDYVVSCTVSDGEASAVDSVSVSVPQQEPVSKIAFIKKSNEDIYVINADGTGLTRLTNYSDDTNLQALDLSCYCPSWSPDGSKIAFGFSIMENLYNFKDDIYVMDADGTNRTKLTDDGCSYCPSWSHDGSKIVFRSHRDGYQAIYIMNADGSNQTLIPNSSGGWGPSLSPDGSKIAFKKGSQIYTMNTDGTDQICLTNNSAINGKPVWSPDGTKIAFQSDIFELPQLMGIYVMNADGSNLTRLDVGSDPSWSPDGSKIAFEDIGSRLFIMNSDGSNKIKLTDFSCYHISWSKIIH